MRTRPGTYPIGKWPYVTRARQPYAFETVTVVPELPQLTLDNAEELQASEQRLLLGPIHPHLWELKPGDADGFINFVSRLGLMEFLRWVGDTPLGASEAWRPIAGAYEALGIRHLWVKHLEEAWTDRQTIQEYGQYRKHLKGLFEETTQFDDPLDAAALIIELGEDDFLQTQFRRDPQTGQIFERPKHIFSRAWFELLNGLIDKAQVPRLCAYCRNPFQPTRSDQRHCPGTQCQPRHSDQKRRKDPWRKEWDKMRKRRDRGTIDERGFNDWLGNNPRPKRPPQAPKVVQE
jgi:hypothetical protein